MDLVAGAKRFFLAMEHATKDGKQNSQKVHASAYGGKKSWTTL